METHFGSIQREQNAIARDRVLADLRTLVRDGENLLRVTANDLSDKAKEARSRMTEAVDRAKQTCQELEQRTIATATATIQRADEVIRQRPYESLGVAFGMGIVIGVLMARK